ncbi:Deleted in malignant brain tumors 1 protein [Holothuria leucospilota]|uniref:Deleted in malignant brain tumors 1 protein n=1 Tax=Holothuria leucospilota TaxID=206669 RepID=A0A9Q1BMF4_HOLLE|nr:Deleted in malignant brain tumors 1 protein [Holothuria leucospilota]
MSYFGPLFTVLVLSVVIDQSNCQTCSAAQCPKSVFNPNLVLNPDKMCYDIGDGVTFACPGNLGGPPSNTCNGNGGPFQGWAIPPGTTCEVFNCTKPTTTDTALNFNPDKSVYDARETLIYSCDQGHSLTGVSQTVCDAQDTWNPATIPLCRISCDAPNIGNGGLTTVGPFTEGSTATVECDDGYGLASGSSSTITCQSDGTWDEVPQCYQNCNVTGVDSSDSATPTTISHGGTKTINCLSGYSYNQQTSLTLVCNNGNLDNTVPAQCYEDCDALSAPSNGGVSGGNLHGQTTTFTCNQGYVLNETASYTCNDGTWGIFGADVPTCYIPEMYTTTLSPETPRDSIRLVGGTSSFEGRVEVLHNGVWGTVCDDYWDVNDARVVCRQLGFTDAETALQNAFFGQGSGIIWLDDLHCSGSEPSLFQCSHSGYGLHNCGHNEDASVRCTDPAENVKLHCGSSSFQVDIPKQLIDGTHYPSDFYLSGDPYDQTCRGFDNGAMYISLNSSFAECGTHLNDTGTHILYENMVEINPSDGNSVVDFLGIEIPITCEYNSSEKLQTHFKTTNEVIRKKAKGSFEFDFAMYTDVTYTVRYYSYPVEMRLNEEMYFRAELLRSASNLEIHLRSCRATPSPDFNNAVVYEFIRAGCGINDSPVRVLTPNQPTQADFEITSFRFRADLSHPESQVWVHCEVVVCDNSDTNSECRQGCEQSRHRRSVEDPPLKVERIVQGPIVFKGEVKEETETFVKTGNEDGFRGFFTTTLSAVSLVMLIGLIVMGVTLRQVIRNSTMGGYQPIPNPSGTTTA